ncbi:MAG: 30S ribosomal protein S16 [Patescibacteria group bacterium]
MLAIKFKKIGKKHQISFRVAVQEKRSKLEGRFTEDLGWFDPHTDKFEVNGERVKYWISKGAQPTASVHNLIVKAGIIKGKKIAVHKKSKKDPVIAGEKTATEPVKAVVEEKPVAPPTA